MCSSAVEVINSLYPRVYSLFRLVDEEDDQRTGDARPAGDNTDGGSEDTKGVDYKADSNLIKLTDTLSPSSEVFESDKMYLVDDRSVLYLLVGRNVPKVVVEMFLDVSSSPLGSGDETASFALQNEMGRKLAIFVDLLKASNPHKQGD